MESLTVAETETEDDSTYVDIEGEGKLQLTAEFTNKIVKNCMSIFTMCRNYLFIVELEKSVHKNWMGRLPYFHVRMNYFW